MESLVSIITPTYNSEAFVEQTIESVINQIHQNWELIIVDDGSTDQTTKIVSESAKKDNRIVLISLKENNGPAKARNEGITRALGKLLRIKCFLYLPLTSVAMKIWNLYILISLFLKKQAIRIF